MYPSVLLPYNPQRDVYRLLGVDPAASTDEIVAACRRLTRTFHPDYNGSPRATQEMQVVNAVRRVLTDQELRAEYDTERARWLVAAAVPPPVRAVRPVGPVPQIAGPPRAGRYARAALTGLRVAVSTLAPPRCADCRMVLAEDDAYCAACGTRLRTA